MSFEGRVFCAVPGTLIEDLGGIWAAFSPLSGASLLLNNSSAAVLEVLGADGPLSAQAVSLEIARQVDLPPAEIEAQLAAHWDELLRAGLIREQRVAP